MLFLKRALVKTLAGVSLLARLVLGGYLKGHCVFCSPLTFLTSPGPLLSL